jgi:putative heme degradation protein
MTLLKRYEEIKNLHPRMRRIQICEELACSEGELVLLLEDSQCYDAKSLAFQTTLNTWFSGKKSMCLINNGLAVFESIGQHTLNKTEIQGENSKIYLGGTFWEDNIIVSRVEESRGRKLPSIQIYNHNGLCLLKIYDLDQEVTALDQFTSFHANNEVIIIPPETVKVKSADQSENFDSKVDIDEEIADKLFTYFSGKKVQVRVDGETIYGTWIGDVKQTKKMQNWQNILQPDFNLHFDIQKASSGDHQASTLSFTHRKSYGVGFTIHKNENWIAEVLHVKA